MADGRLNRLFVVRILGRNYLSYTDVPGFVTICRRNGSLKRVQKKKLFFAKESEFVAIDLFKYTIYPFLLFDGNNIDTLLISKI